MRERASLAATGRAFTWQVGPPGAMHDCGRARSRALSWASFAALSRPARKPTSERREIAIDSLLFHPKVVHLPMALAVLMPLVAGGLLLAWWRAWLPRRAWLVAIGLQAALLGSGALSLQSGEREEERVERVVAERLIEAHEDAAQSFVVASGGVLAAMVLAAALGPRRASLPLAAAATLGTLLVLVLGYRTGDAGGRLVYEHGAARAYTESGPTSPEPAEAEDED